MTTYSWYLDLTPNKMFSLYEYPIKGKEGLSLCEKHGRQFEMKEVVVYDMDVIWNHPPKHARSVSDLQ